MTEQLPKELSDADLDGVTGGGGPAGVSTISSINVAGMDLEAAMMAIQNQRAGLLESQLQDQIKGVQDRNAKIADLNGVLGTFNAVSSLVSKTTDPSARVTDQWGNLLQQDGSRVAGRENLVDLFKTSNGGSFADPSGRPDIDKVMTDLFKRSGLVDFDYKDMTKSELDKALSQVKGQIDGQSNQQQMDMLRLQSLSNKRNEAFDVMTNFIKKMQDSRSSIIGNMR